MAQFRLGNIDDECKAAVLRAVNLFHSLGFQVHPEKSCLTPKQEIDVLVFTINSKNMTLKLRKQKRNKFLENLDVTLRYANNITIREFSKIFDMLEATILVLNMVVFTFLFNKMYKSDFNIVRGFL